jgi:hypothetical protein
VRAGVRPGSLVSSVSNLSEWALVSREQRSGQFIAPSCPLASFALYVEGPSPGTTLYVDDAAVAQTCP